MQVKHVNNHDYITVSAINGGCRMNLTISRSGAKCTSSMKPGDPNNSSFKVLLSDKSTAILLQKFLRGGFSSLVPAGQDATNGNGAEILKTLVESSNDHAEFISKLRKALIKAEMNNFSKIPQVSCEVAV